MNCFFKIPNTRRSQNHSSYFDVEELFKSATGIPLLEYFGIGFLTLSRFLGAGFDEARRSTSKFSLNPRSAFNETKTSTRRAIKALTDLTASPTRIKLLLEEEIRRTQQPYYALTPFKKHPLLKLPNQQVIPASIRFLEERITSGIYWKFLDLLYPKGGSEQQKANSNKFTEFFGDIFEQYVLSIVRRILPATPASIERVLPSFIYGATDENTADITVVYPGSLVLIECKSSRLRRDTGITGNVDEFAQDLRKSVYKASQQLNRVINDFRYRKWSIDHVSASDIKAFYPVVVTLEPVPVNFITRRRIDAYVKRNRLLQARDIWPIVILTAEELEILEGLLSKGHSLLELLTSYTSSVDTLNQPFKNFLYEHYSGDLAPSDHLIAEYHEAIVRVQQYLFGRAA